MDDHTTCGCSITTDGIGGWRCESCGEARSGNPLVAVAPPSPLLAHKHLIEVGDYVRWERGPSMPWNWVEGEVIEVSASYLKIRIYVQAIERGKYVDDRWFNIETSDGCSVRRIPRLAAPAVDPLDVEHDGVSLRLLIEQDEMRQRTERYFYSFEPLTPDQRAAVSAHWSAELRAKVAASDAERKTREVSVLCQGDHDDDEPWWSR